ncbi:Ger(x)C family spore germination protein [Niallia sp. Krafla_26]|uniref:Ger(x)C family spore germination protein n=1 Tax=Niallia sp. Krafla_26 TaxID=3064703 RepID=UPI003D16269C
MNKWKRKRGLLILFFCIVVLFGCSRTKIIDKVSIIHLFGFDEASNGELVGTALYPEYTKNKSGDKVSYLEEQAPASNLVVSKMSSYTSMPLEIAKMRVILFGKDFAKAGIGDTVERLIMTPQIGTNTHIVVTTQSARETLKTFEKEKTFTLAERIQQNMQGQMLPKMNLHIFLNHFYGEGMDAYVPILGIEKDKIKVEGLGVFKDDQLKLQLNPEQSVLFKFLKDRETEATYKVNFDEQENKRDVMVFRSFRSNKKWGWDQKNQELHCDLKLEVALFQYPNQFDVENPKDLEEMRKIVTQKIKTGLEDLITNFQENGVDPIGIGNIVRSKDKSFEAESFYKKYPDLPIHINVNLEIIHSGLEG